MAETIASLQAVVGADITGLTRGLEQAKSSLTGFGKDFRKSFDFGGTLANAGAALTGLTAPLAAFGATGLNTAAKFDSAMAEISARTGLVGKDLEQIRDLALDMGAKTSFSAQQAAEAFLQLLASGQTSAEAIKTLPAVLDAAAASGEDVGRTADMITDIMAAFQLPVSEAANVVDSLSKAAGASSADIASLGMGFGNVAGVARKFGLTVDDTAAVLAIFAENGVKGAEAGTALRSMLNHMAQDTDAVQGAWTKLGTSLFDATGNIRPLKDVMKDIKVALAGMTEEQQVKVIHDLVGTYGQLGLTALTSSISIDEMEARMKDSAKASDVAAKRMNTFSGKVESLKGSIEALQIKAITPLMDKALAPMVGRLTEIVNKVGEWVTANPILAENITRILAAVTSLGPALFIAGKGIGLIGSMLAIATGPIGLLAAGVALLGVAFSTNFLGIRDAVMSVVSFFEPAISRLISIAQDFARTLFEPGSLPLGERISLAVSNALPEIQETIEHLLENIKNWIVENAPKIYQAFQDIIGQVGDWLGSDGPGELVLGLTEMVKGAANWLINTGWPIFKTGIEGLWSGLVMFIQGDGVQRFITGLGAMISNGANWLLTTGIPNFVKAMSNLGANIVLWFQGDGWVNFREGLIGTFMNMAKWIRDDGWPKLKSAVSTLVNNIGLEFDKLKWRVINAIVNGVREAMGLPGISNTGLPDQSSGNGQWAGVRFGSSSQPSSTGASGNAGGGGGFTPFAKGGFAPIGTRFMAGEAGPELGVVGPAGTTFRPMYSGGGGGTKTINIMVIDRDLEARLESILERELAD